MRSLMSLPLALLLLLLDIGQSMRLMLSTAIQAPKGRRTRDAERSRVNFDEIGNLPNLEEVYTDIEKNASPIVAIRFVYDNAADKCNNNDNNKQKQKQIQRGGILFAYIDNTLDAIAVGNQSTTSNRDLRLNSPVASDFVQNITSGYDSNRYSEGVPRDIGRQCLLVTGYVGDCRAVAHKAVMIHYNHTNEFDGPASGGNSVEVYAGMSGRNMKEGVKILEKEYNAFKTTLEDAKLIAERMIAFTTDRSLHDALEQREDEQQEKESEEREVATGRKVNSRSFKVRVGFTVLYDYYNG